jgi:hypothetical protein
VDGYRISAQSAALAVPSLGSSRRSTENSSKPRLSIEPSPERGDYRVFVAASGQPVPVVLVLDGDRLRWFEPAEEG